MDYVILQKRKRAEAGENEKRLLEVSLWMGFTVMLRLLWASVRWIRWSQGCFIKAEVLHQRSAASKYCLALLDSFIGLLPFSHNIIRVFISKGHRTRL